MQSLTAQDRQVLEVAKRIALRFKDEVYRDKNLSSVGAAIRTPDGKIFAGPNIKHPYSSATGICAEYNAAAQVYTAGYREVELVANYYAGERGFHPIATPCGKCREFLRMFGNPYVVVQVDGEMGKVRLSEMLPYPFS